jgi:hypothetical protein
LYDLGTATYRNDYSFSIAIHILEDMLGGGIFHTHLPGGALLTAFSQDSICQYKKEQITLLSESDRTATPLLTTISNRDIHVMNKPSLMAYVDAIRSCYE